MCPVESPAGADGPAARVRSASLNGRMRVRFSRAAACRLVGLEPSELARWERTASREIGLRLPASLAFPDLVALSALRAVFNRVGKRAGAFTTGLAQLFTALAERTDIERLDDHVALIGHDFARLARLRSGHVCCAGDDFIVVPLRTILADLRDQVFS
jgi:hypothetical protein